MEPLLLVIQMSVFGHPVIVRMPESMACQVVESEAARYSVACLDKAPQIENLRMGPTICAGNPCEWGPLPVR
jgi:hypothetical protein